MAVNVGVTVRIDSGHPRAQESHDFVTSALPPDVRRGSAPGCEAMPPDVRRGSAPPTNFSFEMGYAPRPAFGPAGRSPNQGLSPISFLQSGGGAKPRLTSGGRASHPRAEPYIRGQSPTSVGMALHPGAEPYTRGQSPTSGGRAEAIGSQITFRWLA